MSIRKILVPVFGMQRDGAALDSALSLAARYNAQVEALFVRPDPLSVLPYGYLNGDMAGYAAQYALDAAVKASDGAQKAAKDAFDERTAKAKADASLRVVQGDFVTEIEQRSRLCDLIVFGGSPGELDRIAVQEGLEAALLSGARPVLFIPPRATETIGERIAIAFDGSASAAHAVTAALPFLTKAKEVHAFEVSTERSPALAELKEYLALHDVKVVTHTVTQERQSIGGALLDAAQKADCDMIVLGGYGHSRLREFVFGGVTRHVLRQTTPMTVLMAH